MPDSPLAFLEMGKAGYSKQVFQSKLHDSRIACSIDLTKDAAVQIRNRISRMQAVGHVVRLNSNLQSPGFPQLEDSRQSRIELPYMGPLDIPRSHVPETSHIRQR